MENTKKRIAKIDERGIKMDRKHISKKLRFEVFKRDNFTCQYCGRMAPDVILEVDHIKPVCKGGENDILNLITSCKDCNRGKGKSKLCENDVLKKSRENLKEISIRNQQIEMMMKWKEELSSIEDYQVYEIAFETIEIFDNRLYAKLSDIMNYYNQLYLVEKLKNQIGYDDLINKRLQDYTNTLANLNATNITDGLIKNSGEDITEYKNDTTRTPELHNDTKNTYGKTSDGNNTNTTNFQNLGGKDFTENASLTSTTPQNNSPINENTSNGFDSFNNSVFKINGYITNADKNLSISELNSKNKTVSENYYHDESGGEDKTANYEYGTDTTNQSSLNTLTHGLNTKNDTTITNNQNNNTDFSRFGNSDYIKSIQDLRDILISIDSMICRDLRELFLYVY